MSDDIQTLMQQGEQFLKAEQLHDAQNCYLKVLSLASDASEAYFRLAWIAQKQGQVLSARKNLKKAYDLQPNNKEYLIGLSQLYAQTSKFDEAISCYRSFLSNNDTEADVNFHYACLLAQTQRIDEALEAFHRSIALDPTQLSYYMKLGELLYHLLRYDEAMKIYYQALEAGLVSKGLYSNIAKMHVDAGQADKALAILKQANSQFPDTLFFAYRLSSLDKASLNTALLTQLNTIDPESGSNEEQFYYYWLKAQYACQENDAASELSLLIKAHEAYHQSANFPESSDSYLQRLLQLSHLCGLVLEQNPEPISASLSPIFIVGVPRCGSTLIENIICAGPQDVIKGEETGTLFHALKHSTQSENFNWSQFKASTDSLYQKHQIAQDKTLFTDKSLENIFFIDIIFSLYPQAKVIYCDRSPLASTVSILKNNMAVLPWAHRIDSILSYIDQSFQAIDKAMAKHPNRILHIKYEDLVVAPESQSQKIMAFCDLNWHESCLAFHEKQDVVSKTASHLQIRKPINQDALHTHKAYETLFSDYVAQYPWLK